MRYLAIDIETYSSVDIQKSGAYKYVESDDFRILLFAYAFDGEPVRVIDIEHGERLPKEVLEALRPISGRGVIKTAYNAAFEMLAISKFLWGGRSDLDRMREIWISQWECTMVKGLYYGYPAGLRLIGDAFGLAEDKKKLYTGNALIRYFCIPDSKTGMRRLPSSAPDKWELFKDYCRQDVVTEREIRDRLPELPELILKEWRLDWRCVLRGVRIDTELVGRSMELVSSEMERKKAKASELTGLSNPNSPAQLKGWLNSRLGLSGDSELESLNKKKVAELLESHKDGAVAEVLKLRQELGKSSVSKYQAALNCVCRDGRTRGLIQYYGAGRTGRWAGRLIQVQNLPQNHLDDLAGRRNFIKSGVPKDDVPLMSQLSQLFRTVLIPSSGCRFAVADFSAIEARVIAWLAGERWREKVFLPRKKDGGGKIYETSAAMMFKVPVETIVKGHENYALRQKGKIAELALGYGGGKGAMRAMGASEDDFTDKDIYDLIDKWRAASPNIVKMWSRLEELARNQTDGGMMKSGDNTAAYNGTYYRMDYYQPDGFRPKYGIDAGKEREGRTLFEILKFRYRRNTANLPHGWLEIELPSGRCLYYVNFREDYYEKYGAEIPDALVYDGISQVSKQWSVLETYGGKLTENIVQAIARDCLMLTLERLEAKGFRPVMHVHDEVICEVSAEEAESRLEQMIEIMRTPIPWAPGLVLDADGFTEDFYKKD